jgi:hypothetical protein
MCYIIWMTPYYFISQKNGNIFFVNLLLLYVMMNSKVRDLVIFTGN